MFEEITYLINNMSDQDFIDMNEEIITNPVCLHATCNKKIIMRCEYCGEFVAWDGTQYYYPDEEVQLNKYDYEDYTYNKYQQLEEWCKLFYGVLVSSTKIEFGKLNPFFGGDESTISAMINHLLPDGTSTQEEFEYYESEFGFRNLRIRAVYFEAD